MSQASSPHLAAAGEIPNVAGEGVGDSRGTLARPLPLFAGIGVELEYMIVAAGDLSVLPVADELIRRATGAYDSEVCRDSLAWSNELVMHLIELKVREPAPTLAGLADRFQSEACFINGQLQALSARLMPTGTHPWMNPATETRLWPHQYHEVYECFDRIFGCRRHGWANLQSMHLNLPFADDLEFARLHAAIRLVLPLLPALAASSPVCDGQLTGGLDSRLVAYKTNASLIPSITGCVIPEPVFSRREYEAGILGKMYRDIAPHDPEGILRDEFLNARGAIARFSRQSIEVRVIDVQECPQADLTIAAATVAILRALVEERWSDLESQQSFSAERLEAILNQTVAAADAALIEDRGYLRALGVPDAGGLRSARLWRHLLAEVSLPQCPDKPHWERTLEVILDQGCLARRILRALRGSPDRERLREVYGQLCDCLATGTVFSG